MVDVGWHRARCPGVRYAGLAERVKGGDRIVDGSNRPPPFFRHPPLHLLHHHLDPAICGANLFDWSDQ